MLEAGETWRDNRLLAAMPTAALEAIAPFLEPTILPIKTVLVETNTPISHAHFLLDGIAVHVAGTSHGQLELGLIGREGVSAPALILGANQTPHETVMQVAGSSLRISSAALMTALDSCEVLRAFLLRYVEAQNVATAYLAIAAARFKIEQRTARSLLMCHDRIDGDLMPLTHAFLSEMLGVRRAGVTDAIHLLEGTRAIRATRGWIEIRNRDMLETIAGESYGASETQYARLIGVSIRGQNPPPAADPRPSGSLLVRTS